MAKRTTRAGDKELLELFTTAAFAALTNGVAKTPEPQAPHPLPAPLEEAAAEPEHEVPSAPATQVPAATHVLTAAHRKYLYSHALRMMRSKSEADDLVQDTLVRAHRKLAGFDGASRLETWLYKILLNLARDRWRTNARRGVDEYRELAAAPKSSVVALGGVAPLRTGLDPEAEYRRAELREKLNAALDSLTPEHREVFLLREFEGHPYRHIAELVGIPEGTVMSRLFHARQQLQQQLEEE